MAFLPVFYVPLPVFFIYISDVTHEKFVELNNAYEILLEKLK